MKYLEQSSCHIQCTPLRLYASSNATPFARDSSRIPAQFLYFHESKVSFAILSSPFTNGQNAKVESSSTVYGNQDNAAKSSERVSQSGSTIKAPTAPWVKGPLLLEPNQLRNFLQDLEKIPPQMKLNNTLIRPWLVPGKVNGGRGKKAMKKIFQGIEKLQEAENLEETQWDPENVKFRFAPGDLWGNAVFENVVGVQGD